MNRIFGYLLGFAAVDTLQSSLRTKHSFIHKFVQFHLWHQLPHQGTLITPMKHHFNILYQTTKASFKLRNESSYLGVFWYLLGPLLTFSILYIVFSGRLGSGVEHYPLYLLTGIIVWNFYSAGSSRSIVALMNQGSIIKSLSLRRDVLVIASIIDIFISHLFELLIFLGFCIAFGVITATALFFPLILFLQFLFVLGTGFALSSLHFVFGDLGQVWSVLTKAWWFATPIFYTLNKGGPGEKVSLFNPMYHSITLSREVLVYGELPNLASLCTFAAFSFITLVIGYLIFRKLAPRFAEYI